MLLDDLLGDEPAMRRLSNLFRRRPRRIAEAQAHESFLDQVALQEELAARLSRHVEAERREPTLAVLTARRPSGVHTTMVAQRGTPEQGPRVATAVTPSGRFR